MMMTLLKSFGVQFGLAALLLTLSACPGPVIEPPPPPPPTPVPPPPPPPVTTVNSTSIGTVNLEWNTGNYAPTTDSSGTVRFTPTYYSDIDDFVSKMRYLTMGFTVENLSAVTIDNLGVRAVARDGNLGGTAMVEVRAFPSDTNPDGDPFTDVTVAHRITPIQGTILAAQPVADPHSSDFQAYKDTESLSLQDAARTAALIGANDTVLDYGFVTRVCSANCTQPAANTVYSRTVTAAGTARIAIAFKLPRSFTPLPKPYRFKISFLVTKDDAVRVTRGVGESTDAAVARGTGLVDGGVTAPVQLLLAGTDTDAPSDPRLTVLRILNPRIGTAPTGLFP
ncbi:MAG: hypothetical protein HC933_19765 [Pleurocapsa sp. SU_196_0]|nr:hypothetical protein [Pleurocapsa sp. SU_196_0]